MPTIRILTVGSLKEKYWRDAVAEYTKRLSAAATVELIELPEASLPNDPSPAQIAATIKKEGEQILQKIPPRAHVTALCVEGKPKDSPGFSDLLFDAFEKGGATAVFIIGGSYGLADEVKKRADVRLSFSPMTFPHQLMRVILLEQLYRGVQIRRGTAYHK